MPYSFTQIEEDKTKTIKIVFTVLILFYFVTFWLLALMGENFLFFNTGNHDQTTPFSFLSVRQTLIVFGVAILIGYAHWRYTTANLIPKIMGVLGAQKLDPNDTYHKTFKNIVDEVSVATGGKKMEAVVIPTSAMNACAVADFSGKAVIGVTEGLLARLTRAQIEAVVGHEAAHIVTGDCLATTVTSSLFELYSGLLRGFELMFRGRHSNVRFRSSGRGGGGAIAFLLMVYCLLAVTKFLSQLVKLFISRQREYRADAIAVRLTRDPLSLAEALYSIKHHWRGGGLASQELEAIFTVNPSYYALDEKKGLFAEMFSTHPPMEERLKILLNMAHADAKTMIEKIERKSERPRVQAPQAATASSTQWVVNKDGYWKGPFSLIQLATLGWIKPETWVQRIGEDTVKMAYEEQDISSVFSKADDVKHHGSTVCPQCHNGLVTLNYEGTEVYKCAFCQGTLVKENDIKRIIIRQEVGFSDQIKRIGDQIKKEDKEFVFKEIERDPHTLLVCPQCRHVGSRMMRMFYTEAYRVEIDKCFTCGLIWFDRDELEVLQYLIESNIAKTHS